MGFEKRRGAPERAPQRANALIVTDGNSVQRDRIWVRRTPVGYLLMGFAPTEPIARFAFEGEADQNPFFTLCRRIESDVARGGKLKADQLGLKVPLNRFNDPVLRRLAIADKLIKEGFNPDEPRNARGEWTSEGGGTSAGAAVATTAAPVATDTGRELTETVAGTTVASVATDIGSDLFSAWRIWTADALALLPRIAAGLNVFTLAGGLILIPGNRSGGLESQGTLPDNPDIAYERMEGRLTLYRVDEDGNRTKIYEGYPGADHYYRDEQGNVVAQDLGIENGFVADPTAITALAMRGPRRRRDQDAEEDSDADSDAQAAARARSIAKDEPQLCPDPGPDRPGYKSPRAMEYQMRVTGLPPGLGVLFNDVMFDGCREIDGTLLEAKGPGYARAMDDWDEDEPMSPDLWRDWYTGR
ncbi:MAG TPA: Tox-REase-5 domain-containing protein [Stellaceae bacterium]|nr:Tox-REase-5 domain-containing protein [Stellaceae bacterium]